MPISIEIVLDNGHMQASWSGYWFLLCLLLHGEPTLEKACSLLIGSFNSTSCIIKLTCIQELQLLMF